MYITIAELVVILDTLAGSTRINSGFQFNCSAVLTPIVLDTIEASIAAFWLLVSVLGRC